jgi:hypothetical protein
MGENLGTRLKSWQEVIALDFPEQGPVTEETVQEMVRYGQTHYVGDVRLATGRVWTDKAYEERRERVLSTPLP